MAFDLRRQILDWEQALRAPLQSWGWIVGSVLVVVCFGIVIAEQWVWTWLFRFAQIVLVGISTALFTRILGGMGMFRDAIADVLGEDRWLDRRNDLDDLWRRITRRIFLPGFREDAPDADRLMAALNVTMNKVVHQPEKQVNYYQKGMKRRIRMEWKDEARRIVRITDYLETTIIPFDAALGCTHHLRFVPTSGEALADYGITLSLLQVDGNPLEPGKFGPTVEGEVHSYVIPLNGRAAFRLEREMIYEQCLDNDPIMTAIAGRGVVWGMHVIIDPQPALNLRINFEEVGVEGEFRRIGDHKQGAGMEWEAKCALLPNQGFQVVMAQTGAGRQPAAGT